MASSATAGSSNVSVPTKKRLPAIPCASAECAEANNAKAITALPIDTLRIAVPLPRVHYLRILAKNPWLFNFDFCNTIAHSVDSPRASPAPRASARACRTSPGIRKAATNVEIISATIEICLDRHGILQYLLKYEKG